ncbi:rhodanese domain-containing protein CG4456-like [Mytilus californianus]|uniref:rhodanese domain-containing protein CG4456-like n=1 Tax=Mytilus californianus TaxID=6549 RepID=UPI0022476A1B|nr:rhodanese domain-containing protein CG4456-like [Mytilus californianus]
MPLNRPTTTNAFLDFIKNYSLRTPDTPNVEYDQLVSGLKDGSMVLIDVRDAYELDKFGRFHQNAINVPLDQLAETFNMSPEHFKVLYGYDLPELEDNIVFVCRSGERSSSAVEMAIEYGYEK